MKILMNPEVLSKAFTGFQDLQDLHDYFFLGSSIALAIAMVATARGPSP
jgi:hypothetical protein